MTQMLASWAIEGFDPDVEYLALLDRYINGELTIVQIQAITEAKFRAEHTSVLDSPISQKIADEKTT